MILLLISFVLMLVVLAAMSIGVIMGREPVKGSCGGLSNIDGMGKCELCGGKPADCKAPGGS